MRGADVAHVARSPPAAMIAPGSSSNTSLAQLLRTKIKIVGWRWQRRTRPAGRQSRMEAHFSSALLIALYELRLERPLAHVLFDFNDED